MGCHRNRVARSAPTLPGKTVTAPRRVALVSDWCLPRKGGIETHILALATRLRQRGVDATIITSFPGPDMIDGVPIDRIDCLRLPIAPIALSPGLVGMVRRRLEAGRYDMVHVHCSIVAPLCFAAMPAARSLGLPVLVTFHSVMSTMPHFLALSDRLLGWTHRSVTLTAVSGLVARQAASRLHGTAVGTLPNGFDEAFWRRTTPALPRIPGRIRVVSALRLERRKRPLALVEVFAEAVRRTKDSGVDLSLTIAGDGSLRPAVERRIASLGLAGTVDLVGWQGPEALRKLYTISSLFVMPSRKEAFCIAALEARAAGLPVVANAGTGIADFIHHDETGLLAQSDADMAQAIATLAQEPARLKRLAEADGRLSRYDWDRLADEHVALYRQCLAGKTAGV